MSAVRKTSSRDLRALFGSLAERERVKGHHSAEGRSIRTVSRAMSAWTGGGISEAGAAVLCRQAMEDWLKARLNVSLWSSRRYAGLVARAAERGLITSREAGRLKRLDETCSRLRVGRESLKPAKVRSVFEFCARFLERRW